MKRTSLQAKPPLPIKAAEMREFGRTQDQRPMMTILHRRAEARLRKLSKGQRLKNRDMDSKEDPRRQLHELQVHQIELEMQNAELQEVRERTEVLLEKYADLYDFAPVGYFTLSANGRIRQANLNGASLVGIERSRLLGRHFGQLLSAKDRPAFRSFLRQAFKSRTKLSGEFGLASEGRPPRTVRIEVGRSPNFKECRAVVLDITGRKQAEDKLRISEVRYRRLFEAAHDGVLLLDPETCKITDANPFMTKLLGYQHTELVGKELFEIGLLKDEGASREMFRQLKRTRQVRYENLPLESRTGRHQEVEVVANLYQESGHSVIQCNIRDITERKLAEGALRRNEALFSTLIEQAPVGVYVVDDQFRLQQVNRKAAPAFKKIHPLVGRCFSEILHALWPKRVAAIIEKLFRRTLTTGEPYQSPEFTARRQDIGKKEIFEWQIQRVTLPAGEHGVVCFFNNITERKRAEEVQRRVEVLAASNRKLEREIVRRRAVETALKKSERHQRHLLEQSTRQQDQLRHLSRQILTVQEQERKEISRELHDVIAQTLTGINIRLAALKRGAEIDIKGLNRNIASTQRMVEHSVNIVHQFARELRPAVLDDLGLIPALHSLMKSFMSRTGIQTRLKVFADVEQLTGNKRTVLYRVAQEALTNVARHAKASRVEVKIQKRPDCVSMTIIDDGKSFRVERTLRPNGNKHLGLLGMKERVEMVGGAFYVKSAPGKGTAIEARIPLGKPRAQEGKTPTPTDFSDNNTKIYEKNHRTAG